MRTDGIFIGIEVSDDAIAREPKLASQLSQVCPVDIYREAGDGGLEIVAENVDECVLCRLCLELHDLDIADGDVQVLKLYDKGAALT
jgi:ferredoxin-like protein FixX